MKKTTTLEVPKVSAILVFTDGGATSIYLPSLRADNAQVPEHVRKAFHVLNGLPVHRGRLTWQAFWKKSMAWDRKLKAKYDLFKKRNATKE